MNQSTLRLNIEDIFYKKIVKPLMYKSRIGRTSIDGRANGGVNFDYIYGNRPDGDGLFGKLVDYVILNLPAAKMTQNRKEMIKNFILKSKKRVRHLSLLDIASGPSRYSIEAAAELGEGFSAICIDIRDEELEYGRTLARDFGVSHMIEYRNSDVFERKSLEGINPDLTVISGLYAYTDDETTNLSLQMISEIMPSGGSLLVDSQIMNPSQKLIEKTCTTTYGQPWVLHYRKKDHMESIVSNHLQIEESYVDRIGMYHLIHARKVI